MTKAISPGHPPRHVLTSRRAMSEGLESRIVRALRRGALDQFVCALCKQRTSLPTRRDFRAHLDSVHADLIEAAKTAVGSDEQTWREAVERRSRVGSASSPAKPRARSPSQLTSDPASARTSPAPQLQDLTLEPTRRRPRRLMPRTEPRPQPQPQPQPDPGGQRQPKRPHSHDEQTHSRSVRSHSKSTTPRRSANKSSDVHDSPGQSNRSNAFQSNWQGNQPTRQLFDPTHAPPANPVTASQTALPPRKASQPAFPAATSIEISRQTPAPSQTASQTGQQRGILPNITAATRGNRDGVIPMPADPRWPQMLLQPDSRPISQEQLAAEVKSIYAGLTMVESKCIHVDKAQATAIKEQPDAQIPNEHWQALITLHKTLLHEHHDFFLASQHPSASPALRRLAGKYAIPARMLKHGVYSFLELLRYRLPQSLEFMISFIYTAYQMMALLLETVPAFETSWIECLGDLGRCRMAVEDEDSHDRAIWANVSRFWYTKAADRNPSNGILYHHLAILARPDALRQLSLYARSLTAVSVFRSARESTVTLFNELSDVAYSQTPQIYTHLLKAHSSLFRKEDPEDLAQSSACFLDMLDSHIDRTSMQWREQGSFVIIASIGSLFDYGNDGLLRRFFESGFRHTQQKHRAASTLDDASVFESQDQSTAEVEIQADKATSDDKTHEAFDKARELFAATAAVVLKRQGDINGLPFVHILLAFLLCLTNLNSLNSNIANREEALSILNAVPRQDLCYLLNTLSRSHSESARFQIDEFIRQEEGDLATLPEDQLIRGQVWSQDYFPNDFFQADGYEDEEKDIEHASTARIRGERVLNVAYRLCLKWQDINYDPKSRTWSCHGTEDQPIFPITEDSIPPLKQALDVAMADFDSAELAVGKGARDPEYDQPKDEACKHPVQALGCITAEDADMSTIEDKKTAETAIRKGWTYIVWDGQLLLEMQDLFHLLVTQSWTIVLPDQVLAKISACSKSDTTDAERARSALQCVQSAHAQKNLKIITADGSDVTEAYLTERSPLPNIPRSENPNDQSIQARNNLLAVTRCAAKVSIDEQDRFHGPKPPGAICPAILLTEDSATKLLAAAQTITAMAPNALRSVVGEEARKREDERARDAKNESLTSRSEDEHSSAEAPSAPATPEGHTGASGNEEAIPKRNAEMNPGL